MRLVSRTWARIVGVVALAMIVQVAASGSPALAYTVAGPTFTVMNTSETPPDGVYFRNSPHTADTSRIFGLGVFVNERVQLECYSFGDSVGPFNDTLWYFVLNVTRPTNNGATNQGFLNAHYINDGQAANVIDAGVPDCSAPAPSGGTNETAGGVAHTWTNYLNGGGTQGPSIAGLQTVQITCAITGLKVPDGNTWWYQIASSPWSNLYYVSADAFYNNGATSGSLLGTPFVDPAVPQCGATAPSPGTGTTEQEGHYGVSTFANYQNASGLGARISPAASVQVSCKVLAPTIASVSPDGYWYLIASSPWDNQYYAPANTFMNGDPWGGPYSHNTDYAVPDCAGAPRGGSGPTVSLSQGSFKAPGYHYALTLTGFPASTNVGVECYDSISTNGFSPFTLRTDASGSVSTGVGCISGDGPDHWAVVNGTVQSNHVTWGAGGGGGTSGISSSRAGNQGSAPPLSVTSTSCSTIRPVNCASGDFWHSFTDFQIPGRGVPLDFSHTYSSSAAGTSGRLGFGWTDSYNMSLTTSGTNVTVNEEDGASVPFVSDANGHFSAPGFVLATLVSNADGTYTFTRAHTQVRYVFSQYGQLVSELDRNGYATTFGYTGNLLTSITDPAGRSVTITYSGTQISQITDPLGRTETFSYDEAGDLVAATDPRGGVWTFTYDVNHLMLSMADPKGGVTTNVYDAAFRVVSQSDPAGLTTTWSYSGDNSSTLGGVTTMTDPHGSVTTFGYQSLELLSVTRASGTAEAATTAYTYDPTTLGIISATDPNGHTTSSTYDSQGNLLSQTDPLGHTTTRTYNAFNEPLVVTDAAGGVTSDSYDAAGNLLASTDALGHQTVYAYADAAHPGDVSSVTDPDGRVTTFSYDSQGDRATRTVSPSSGVSDTTQLVYDADSEVVCVASPNAVAGSISCPAPGAARVAGTTTTAYDAAGEATSVTDPLGRTTQTTFDPNGNKTSSTSPNGNVGTMAYDADARMTSAVQGANSATPSTTSHAYDLVPGTGPCLTLVSASYCTTTTDPNGNLTVDYFDALGHQIRETRPGGQTTDFGYDLVGNRTSKTDAAARVTTYVYDNANRMTGIAYSDPATPTVSYGYDAVGRRVSMADGTGTTTYAYDLNGRLTAVTNGAGSVVGYGYDQRGDVTTLSYPSGQAVSKTYDGAAQLSSVTDWLGHASTFSYDADGNLTSTAYPNGDTVSSTYDAADALASTHAASSGGTLAGMTFTRNLDQLVSNEVDSGALVGTNTYAYNEQDRLTAANTTAFSYDAAGDMTAQGSAAHVFNPANELTLSTSVVTSIAYTYDLVGDRTTATDLSGAATDYAYDQAGRLLSVTQVLPAPTVTSIAPIAGKTAGGTTVTITGSGFTGATSVVFGTSAATHFTIVSDTKITAVSPAKPVGVVDVTVTSSGGASAVVAADQFAYEAAPSVSAVSPGTGSTAGGGTVTITGTGFLGATKVAFGPLLAPSFTVVSATSISAVAPAHAVGTVAIRVTTPQGASASVPADQFSYQVAPTIAKISPAAGPLAGGGTVTVTGSGFTGATAVAFGSSPAAHFTVVSATKITAVAPAGSAGTVALTVTTALGSSAASPADVFTYEPGPAITLVSPSVGTTAGGTSVTLTGSSFTGATKVTFGSALGTALVVVSATSITVKSPAGAAGSVAIHVTTPAGKSATVTADKFTYSATAAARRALGVTPSLVATTLASMGYNGDGLRMLETTSSGAAHFTWDSSSSLPQVLTDGTNLYVYGPGGLPLEQIGSGGTAAYFVHDNIGSTRALLNASGAVGATFTYRAYGALASSTGTLKTPLLYGQSYNDSATGLDYLVNRYYEPTTGGFITVDPALAKSDQPYSYANSNPANKTDPSGLFPWDDIISVIPGLNDVVDIYETWNQFRVNCAPGAGQAACENDQTHAIIEAVAVISENPYVAGVALILNKAVFPLQSPSVGEGNYHFPSGGYPAGCGAVQQSWYGAASYLQ